MPFPQNPADRSPKGDHNRRLALGLDLVAFASEAGVPVEQLKDYEMTMPDHHFDAEVANRVGAALERLEATMEPKVDNGQAPARDPSSGSEAEPGTPRYEA